MYDKFIFTVLVKEPKSEMQMVLMEMEKILCNQSLIHSSTFIKLFDMFQPLIDNL